MRLDPTIFCSLTALWLRSDATIQLQIPTSMQLCNLQAYVPVLDLIFEDAAASCSGLKRLDILYNVARYPSVSWQLKAKGLRTLEWSHHPQLIQAPERTVLLSSSASNVEITYVCLPQQDISEFWHHFSIFMGAQQECSCMMCWECLKLSQNSAGNL